MKKIVILLAILTLSTGAIAQESPATLALAREVISAMKADQMFDNMAAQMKQSASQMVTPPAGATPEQIKQTAELQDKIMTLSMNAAKGMISKMDHIYAEIYNETELKAMKVFFTSPAGQSMLAKQPQIMGRIMPLMQEMQRDLMPKIKQLVDETKAKAAAAATTATPVIK
jgi:uncharacterized protein